MIQDGSRIVPIEVKSEENLKSKSLSAFLEQNANAHGIRFSMSPYREQERMTNVPLYGQSVFGQGIAGFRYDSISDISLKFAFARRSRILEFGIGYLTFGMLQSPPPLHHSLATLNF